jgi:hypothetical protein
MVDEKGLKEINEIFDGLDVLADFAGSVMKDGKVDAKDITALVSLAVQFGTLSDAIKGAKEAVEEGKDLTKAETIEILGRVYQVVDKFAASKKA